MQLIPVDPNEVPNMREGRRGRVSYPIIKMFLESGHAVVKIDRAGMQQTTETLYACLGAYIRSHEVPISIFRRGGEIFLARTDVEEGVKKETVGTDGIKIVPGQEATPITSEVVAERYEEEKGNVGK
jgi:hypothetical protein